MSGREREGGRKGGRQNLLDFLGGAVGVYLKSCVSEYRRSAARERGGRGGTMGGGTGREQNNK